MAGEGRIQNIKKPYSTFEEGAAPASPDAGSQRIFIDSADHKLKIKNSSGTVTEVGSTVAEDLDISSMTEELTPASGDMLVIDRAGVRKKVDVDNLPGGGGGTLLKSVWYPDAPPASPSAYNDEFDGESGGLPTSGLWTEFDPNSILTIVESAAHHRLEMAITQRTGDNIVGIHQSIPAGDFTVWTRVSLEWFKNNGNVAGIVFWENPADTSKSIMLTSINANSTSFYFEVSKWNNHNSWNSAPISFQTYAAPHIYLRVRRNGSNYYHGYSLDGKGWAEIGTSAANPIATPTKFGLGINQNNTGLTLYTSFDFFRYTNSDVGRSGAMPGQLIKLLG